jgi:tRNA pseudouridine32 synthase/23S rRNA pseudouridine746 synthase
VVPLSHGATCPPTVFPTPFAQGAPHPIARRAAEDLQAYLHEHLPDEAIRGPQGGKMFGVLVVRDHGGRLGALWAFAGTLLGQRTRSRFVPPACDEETYQLLWRTSGAQMEALGEAAASHVPSAERKTLLQEQQAASRRLLTELRATYQLRNALGDTRGLAEIFAPSAVPGGAGDCAAVKLLQHAYRLDLRPVALAEFWWGEPTVAGGRHHGVFYPACRGRCAKILPFMLEGIPCEPPPTFGNHGAHHDAPTTVFEDDDVWVVLKPSGLLSVPGRGNALRDCVQRRLQARAGAATGSADAWPRLAHRLDLDTSGLLVAAKHPDAYVMLQRQFAARMVGKRYDALVHGRRVGAGRIDLRLGPDLSDRPRQVHSPEHGKPAATRWEALGSDGEITRVSLWPRTGRTHQLRVHASHPLGLDAPIVGDRLYGIPDDAPRLMLHAAELRFAHPRTADPIELHAAPEF